MTHGELCSWENLLLAAERAARGKHGSPSAAAIDYGREEQLLDLRSELNAETWTPGGYCSFYIHDPKRRLISAAPFRDRVVHHALCNLTEAPFERGFIHDSYANRVGKGTHRALARLQQFQRRFRFALPCDIRQFFPSVDHALLSRTLNRKIRDRALRRLVARILASGEDVLSEVYDMVWFPGDDLFAAARPRGLPIGNLTSQFWANCYLDPFDHFVKRELRCEGYIRYVDDLVLFADEKRQLWEWKAAIEERLARLRLVIHPGAHPRPVAEGISFLGFISFPTHRRLKRRNYANFARKLREKLALWALGAIREEDWRASVESWIAHASHGQTIGLQKSILSSHGLNWEEFAVAARKK